MNEVSILLPRREWEGVGKREFPVAEDLKPLGFKERPARASEITQCLGRSTRKKQKLAEASFYFDSDFFIALTIRDFVREAVFFLMIPFLTALSIIF